MARAKTKLKERHVGFTGTQAGVTDASLAKLKNYLYRLINKDGFTDFHHGNCVGADEAAHKIAKSLGYRLHCHPCDIANKQASTENDVTYEVKKPLVRNRDIVDASELLIAMPYTDQEELRSGTWSTVRYARKTGKAVSIIVDTGRHEKAKSLLG